MQSYTRTCTHACKRVVQTYTHTCICVSVATCLTRAMKRNHGRRAADTLSVMQCQALETSLQIWIDTSEQRATVLWRFGMYGEMLFGGSSNGGDVLKMAPHIQDLLMNRSLWKLLLTYFPTGRFKDKYIADIVYRLLERFQKINHTKMKDPMFVTWLCKSVHLSMSHIRFLALYTEKFSYRINKLSTAEREQLQEILDLVAKEQNGAVRDHEPLPSETSGMADMASPTSVLRTRVRDHEPLPSETSGTADMASPTSVLRTRIASVLAAFSDSPEQSHARSQALSLESDAQSQVLPSESHVQSKVLLSESNAAAEPPPQKKQRLQQQLVTGSLGIRMLPRCVPLPAARGGINKVCEIGKTTQKTNIHGLQACVERRKTPPTKVCTTLRVSTQSSKILFGRK